MPLSELIRKAIGMWLERLPPKPTEPDRSVPLVDAGRCLSDADEMKKSLYE